MGEGVNLCYGVRTRDGQRRLRRIEAVPPVVVGPREAKDVPDNRACEMYSEWCEESR
jgi:hypothetical protein